MKKLIVFVLGVAVGMAGFAVAQEKLSARKAQKGSATVQTGEPISVMELSPDAEKALRITKNEALVAVIAFDGSMTFFRPSTVKTSPAELPATPVTLHNLESMGLVTFSASPVCVLLRLGGQWVKVCQ